MVSGSRGGMHRDVLVGPDGEVVWETAWEPNVLVNTLRSLLAALVKGDPLGAHVSWWAVGSGDASWDAAGAPADAARTGRTTLYAEAARKAVAAGQMSFVGGSFTNKLEIVSSFTTADFATAPPIPLRELGLFAGGSATPGSGVLVNHRVHPRIDMQPGFTLQRSLRLTF